MTGSSFARAMRLFCQRRPFQRFILEFTTGEKLPINHPEALDFHKEVIVFRAPGGKYRVFDPASVCQLRDE